MTNGCSPARDRSVLELQLEVLDHFLARVQQDDLLLADHAVRLSDSEIVQYNNRAQSDLTAGTFLTPPPDWCRIAYSSLIALRSQQRTINDTQSDIELLWRHCFAGAAAAWNRDYLPVVQAQLPKYEILPITLETFMIWLESWPFDDSPSFD